MFRSMLILFAAVGALSAARADAVSQYHFYQCNFRRIGEHAGTWYGPRAGFHVQVQSSFGLEILLAGATGLHTGGVCTGVYHHAAGYTLNITWIDGRGVAYELHNGADQSLSGMGCLFSGDRVRVSQEYKLWNGREDAVSSRHVYRYASDTYGDVLEDYEIVGATTSDKVDIDRICIDRFRKDVGAVPLEP